MLIRYIGPFPAVDVPELGLCGHSGETDAPDRIAAELVASGAWASVKPPKPPKTPASPATTEES